MPERTSENTTAVATICPDCGQPIHGNAQWSRGAWFHYPACQPATPPSADEKDDPRFDDNTYSRRASHAKELYPDPPSAGPTTSADTTDAGDVLTDALAVLGALFSSGMAHPDAEVLPGFTAREVHTVAARLRTLRETVETWEQDSRLLHGILRRGWLCGGDATGEAGCLIQTREDVLRALSEGVA